MVTAAVDGVMACREARNLGSVREVKESNLPIDATYGPSIQPLCSACITIALFTAAECQHDCSAASLNGSMLLATITEQTWKHPLAGCIALWRR